MVEVWTLTWPLKHLATICYRVRPSVLGPEVVILLLKDLFRRNENILISELQGEKDSYQDHLLDEKSAQTL